MGGENDILIKYVTSNDNYEKVAIPPLLNQNEITSDDEVWLVQCPKSINVLKLDKQKLKFPGKSSCDHLEAIAEKYDFRKYVPIASTSEGNIQVVPVEGSIILREKLRIIKNEVTEECVNKKSSKVPLPEGLKERHPLHGSNFEEKLQLKKSVIERLKNTDFINSHKSRKPHSDSVEIKKEPIDEMDEMNELTSKMNKIKRKKISGKEVSPGKKTLKIKREDDTLTDLAWIRDLE